MHHSSEQSRETHPGLACCTNWKRTGESISYQGDHEQHLRIDSTIGLTKISFFCIGSVKMTTHTLSYKACKGNAVKSTLVRSTLQDVNSLNQIQLFILIDVFRKLTNKTA